MNEWRSGVWILHKTRVVLVGTDLIGVPAAAVAISDGTIDGTMFYREDHREFATWDDAVRFARRKAEELGYAVEYGA